MLTLLGLCIAILAVLFFAMDWEATRDDQPVVRFWMMIFYGTFAGGILYGVSTFVDVFDGRAWPFFSGVFGTAFMAVWTDAAMRDGNKPKIDKPKPQK